MYTSYVFSYIGQSLIKNAPHNAYSTINLCDEAISLKCTPVSVQNTVFQQCHLSINTISHCFYQQAFFICTIQKSFSQKVLEDLETISELFNLE